MPGPIHLLSSKFSQSLTATLFSAAILIPTVVGVESASEEIRLPDIGDPASTVLNRTQEQQLGTIILGQIRSNLNVSNDPELNTYVQSLGTRLLRGGADSGLDFSFLILADRKINAFATPGGVIAVYTGLMATAETESELAGVVAHEIAHVEQRHLARAYANSSKINLATALGVLAAIAVGAYNSKLGSAALQSTLAAGNQAQLSFSRANEQEADRVGMRLLTNANFDPNGMPNFLERLHKATQLNIGPVPEFISTHPVTLSRISDTRNRAAQYRGAFDKDSKRFQYAKARAVAITSLPSSVVDFYERETRSGKQLTNTEKYTYATALTRAGEPLEAITVLSDIQDDEAVLAPRLALARAYSNANRYEESIAILERLDEIYPNHEPVVYYLAESLIDQGKPEEALARLDNVMRDSRHNPALDLMQARAAEEAHKPWISHESMANFYLAHGQYGEALAQLELALNDYRIDPVTQARIRTKRKELRDFSQEQVQ